MSKIVQYNSDYEPHTKTNTCQPYNYPYDTYEVYARADDIRDANNGRVDASALDIINKALKQESLLFARSILLRWSQLSSRVTRAFVHLVIEKHVAK